MILPSEPVSGASESGTDGSDPEMSAFREHTYHVAAGSALAVIAAATVFYRLVEHWTWVDSFYFSCIAVTTVGFGDFAPTTDAAKLFTVAYILTGITLVSVVLNERLRRHSDKKLSRRERSSED